MGDMADYDTLENVNNVGKIDVTVYTCGHCGKRLGNDKSEAQKHVYECTEKGVCVDEL